MQSRRQTEMAAEASNPPRQQGPKQPEFTDWDGDKLDSADSIISQVEFDKWREDITRFKAKHFQQWDDERSPVDSSEARNDSIISSLNTSNDNTGNAPDDTTTNNTAATSNAPRNSPPISTPDFDRISLPPNTLIALTEFYDARYLSKRPGLTCDFRVVPSIRFFFRLLDTVSIIISILCYLMGLAVPVWFTVAHLGLWAAFHWELLVAEKLKTLRDLLIALVVLGFICR